ncbi:cobalamin adenosyltransferase [Proteinivorax tanatarense]|uniref:Cobalamin adenosyltransferase n=1 Tax=Proteinivorax tanatarense TaxID=1260629 RepID=A0AAU7VJI3_9FIRM
MKVLTETRLREEFKNKFPKKYLINSKVMVTPSAQEFIKQKKIELIYEDSQKNSEQKQETIEQHNIDKTDMTEKRPKYKDYYHGGSFQEKPEYMTQLYGNVLVRKDDLRIQLRGKLDSFQAEILKVQVDLMKAKEEKVVKDLDEILKLTREILRAEVLEEPLQSLNILGMDEECLRKASHNPKKYLGVDHIFPNHTMGEVLVKLNGLRSFSREVEILGVQAFASTEGYVQRKDILQALNRLSSGLYILMGRWLGNFYH